MGSIQADDPDFNQHLMKMNIDIDQVKKQVVSKPLPTKPADFAAYSPTSSFINYPSPFGKHVGYKEQQQLSARLNTEEQESTETRLIADSTGTFAEVEQRRTHIAYNEFLPVSSQVLETADFYQGSVTFVEERRIRHAKASPD